MDDVEMQCAEAAQRARESRVLLEGVAPKVNVDTGYQLAFETTLDRLESIARDLERFGSSWHYSPHGG